MINCYIVRYLGHRNIALSFPNDNSEFLKVRGLLVVTYKVHYVGTTFTMKMNSNDKVLCDNIVNKQHVNVLK